MKTAIKEINRKLQNEGIDFKINQYIFDLFNKVYGIKENEKYRYIHEIGRASCRERVSLEV